MHDDEQPSLADHPLPSRLPLRNRGMMPWRVVSLAEGRPTPVPQERGAPLLLDLRQVARRLQVERRERRGDQSSEFSDPGVVVTWPGCRHLWPLVSPGVYYSE